MGESRRSRNDIYAYLMLLVALAMIGVFFAPMLMLTSNSLHADLGMGAVSEAFTLRNYVKFLTDPFYLGILFDTFLLGVIVVTICMVVGYPVAYVLARTRSRFRGTLVFLVIAPLLISVVIRNLGWLPVLGNSGMINWLLMSIGFVKEPLKLYGNFTGVVIGLVHTLLPFMILSVMTVIHRIDLELEEAAINLGASPLVMFWRVLLPLSRPGLLAGYLLVFTLAISAFTTPAMMGGRRVLLMSTYIEQQIRSVLNYGFGSTVAVILMLAGAVLTFLALRTPSQERTA